MNDTYLVVDGVKTQLTEEQKKCLGLSIAKNPFYDHVTENKIYYYVCSEGSIGCPGYTLGPKDQQRINNTNAFTDYDFAREVSKTQELYRKLLKFSYDNNAVDKPWDGCNSHFYICYICYEHGIETKESGWDVAATCMNRCLNEVYFSKESVARRALEEVVKPFLKEFNTVNKDMRSL